METKRNQSDRKSTNTRVNESARQSNRSRPLPEVHSRASEQSPSAPGETRLASPKTVAQELSALDIYTRPSEQLRTTLETIALDTAKAAQLWGPAFSALTQISEKSRPAPNLYPMVTGLQKIMDELLAPSSASTTLANSIPAILNSHSSHNNFRHLASLATHIASTNAELTGTLASALNPFPIGAGLQRSMGELSRGPSTYSALANSMASLQADLGYNNSISAQIANFHRSMTVATGMSDLVANLHKSLLTLVPQPIEFPRLVDPFAPLVAEMEVVGHILDELGYYFWRSWPLAFILEIFKLDHESRLDAVLVTNMLLDITSSDEFAKILENVFLNSPILKGRWPNIADSLRVHRSGIYSQTVRNLLAEIEGILGDVLVAEGLALDDEGKIHRMRNSRKDNELKGLGAIAGHAQHSELQKYEDFRKFRKYTQKKLAPEFNPTRHGRIIDYHTAELSSKLLLYIHGLAATISKHFKGK